MDITKQNILMCEKAVKIQENHQVMATNFYALRMSKDTTFLKKNNILVGVLQKAKDLSCSIIEAKPMGLNIGITDYGCENLIWLPRQDQLQGMIDIPSNAIMVLYLASNLVGFIRHSFKGNTVDGEDRLSYPNWFDSMEQIWLAFVMKEKYNKVWTGKNWETL